MIDMYDPSKLKEAVLADPELKEAAWDIMIAQADQNPLFKKVLREGLYSDVAGALGAVHDVVWKAAWPNAIGREILKTLPTTKVLERVPKELSAVAYELGEAPPMGTGARTEFTDINVNIEIGAKKEWSESYIEDASWNVLAYQIENIGKALAKKETEYIIALYNAVTAAKLAGAAEQTITNGAPTWAQIVDIINTVAEADYIPDVIALHATEFGYLFNHDQFINSLYLPAGKADMRNGVIFHSALNVKFVRSTLLTKTLVVDLNAAGLHLVRRDIVTKSYEDPSRHMWGVSATMRYGGKILREGSVARGDY